MIHGPLIHPPLLRSLAAAGHGSHVLIADGNYPASTTLGPNADLIHLNLAPGLVDGPQLLRVLLATVPVERAVVMSPDADGAGSSPAVWAEYAAALAEAGVGGLDELPRYDFYAAARGDDVALTIATGESRLYANLLLTIGVVHASDLGPPTRSSRLGVEQP